MSRSIFADLPDELKRLVMAWYLPSLQKRIMLLDLRQWFGASCEEDGELNHEDGTARDGYEHNPSTLLSLLRWDRLYKKAAMKLESDELDRYVDLLHEAHLRRRREAQLAGPPVWHAV